MLNVSKILSAAVLFAVMLFIPRAAIGQDDDVPRVTESYALTGAMAIVAPGDTLRNATILIEDGLIKGVAAGLEVPLYYRPIPCDSMYVYAGFIEGICNTGIPAPERPARNGNNGPNAPEDQQPIQNSDIGISPEHRASEEFRSSEASVNAKRKLGFTTSMVVPEHGMLPGKGSLISLGTGATDHLVLKDDVCAYARFEPSRMAYPRTVIGVMAKFRELYIQTQYLKQHMERFENAESGVPRPKYDEAEYALLPVVTGKLPVYFYTSNSLDMYKALGLQDELGFKLSLVEVREGWYLQDKLSEMDMPVLVSLDLPEQDQKSKSGDSAAKDSTTATEMTPAEVEKEHLIARRDSSREMHYRNAAIIASTGIPFAFSTLDVKDKNIHDNIVTMIEHGLSEEDALAALTTNAAQLYGMENILGSIEKGKIANLVVSNAPYFSKDAQVKYVFVEGEKFEFEIKEKGAGKKSQSGSDEIFDLAGRWSLNVEIPNDPQSGTLTITGNDGNYKGEIIPDDGDVNIAVSNVIKDGNNVTFSIVIIDGTNSLPADFEITLDGDSFTGTMRSDVMGAFSVSGDRIP